MTKGSILFFNSILFFIIASAASGKSGLATTSAQHAPRLRLWNPETHPNPFPSARQFLPSQKPPLHGGFTLAGVSSACFATSLHQQPRGCYSGNQLKKDSKLET